VRDLDRDGRFAALTEKIPFCECWFWLGGPAKNGYGRFRWERGREVYAHRASWLLSKGQIPDGLFVLHHCDNRLCVNPGHLFLGTQAVNVADMIAKGRHSFGARHIATLRPARGDRHGSRTMPERYAIGERHHRARLTDWQVLEIRTSPESQRALSRRYGVQQSTISRIRSLKRRAKPAQGDWHAQ
jgi:hypothetical protein